jgi:hypothetical protein
MIFVKELNNLRKNRRAPIRQALDQVQHLAVEKGERVQETVAWAQTNNRRPVGSDVGRLRCRMLMQLYIIFRHSIANS